MFSILIIVLIASLFIQRFWCRYLCPLGATMAPLSKIGITRITRDETCIDCKLCDKVCPMKVKVSTVDSVKDCECIDCMECVRTCPKKSLSIKAKNKHISIITYTIAIIVLFLTIIIGSKVAGLWQAIPSTNLQSMNGTINIDNIRGWMSLKNISDSTDIPLNIIITDWYLPQNIDINIALKDIAKKYNITFDVEAFKEYLKTFDYTKIQTLQSYKQVCPWHIQNDPYPGKCGLYVDANKDNICDLS